MKIQLKCTQHEWDRKKKHCDFDSVLATKSNAFN